MARKHSDDYIPSYGDFVQQQDEMKEYQRTHGDPRAKYRVTYKVHGEEQSEDVLAMNPTLAIEQVTSNWNMVGIYITNATAIQIDISESEKMAHAKKTESVEEENQKQESEEGV